MSDTRELTRRQFLNRTGGMAVTAAAANAAIQARAADPVSTAPGPDMARGARALCVLPVLTYELPEPRENTSWRGWGELHTEAAVAEEAGRIAAELAKLSDEAEFGLRVMPVATVRTAEEAQSLKDIDRADAVLLYPAGGGMDLFDIVGGHGKPVLFFIRHKSGPYYLWHEIMSSRYRRQHTDAQAHSRFDHTDVVVDDYEEALWRLRALYAIQNTVGRTIVAIGGPGGWAAPNAPDLARERFGLDIRTVEYEALDELVKAKRADPSAMARANEDGEAYLRKGDVSLKTEPERVANGFILADVFRDLMAEANACAITVNGCMGQIMPVAQAAPCLTLSLLNDDGYMAYCESDFVVIPSGILMHFLSGKPTFFCNPTFPHQGRTVFAHCTAPRRMDGERLEPVKLVSHFESDLGPAPKVKMREGQVMTFAMPNFGADHWSGLRAKVLDCPSHPICRSQVEVEILGDWQTYAMNQEGFHHMGVYGDYLRELPYALKQVGIKWTDYSA